MSHAKTEDASRSGLTYPQSLWRRMAQVFLCAALLTLGLAALTPSTPAIRATETPQAELYHVYLPALYGPEPARLVIAAAHIDSALAGEADEAFLLWNVGGSPQALAGWRIATQTRQAQFPSDTPLVLEPGARLWCAAQRAAFRQTFGETPACSWDDEPDHTGAQVVLQGRLQLANNGGYLQLRSPAGQPIDTLLYGATETLPAGWIGPPAQLYHRGGIGREGQVWQRKQDPQSGLPVDSDQASDWSGDLADLDWGRRVRRPGWLGWDHTSLARPLQGSAHAWITVAVGPEGLYTPFAHHLSQAQSAIDLSLFTFEHPELAQLVAQRATAGVRVRLLLEGNPPGGVSLLQRWATAHMAQAGVEIHYSAVHPDAPRGFTTRYRYAHAKYGIIDNRVALLGTENIARDAMPVPHATGAPQGGRRGYFLFTDAQPVIDGLARIFTADYAPDRFLDLLPYDVHHPRYGAPPADFLPGPAPLYSVTAAPFAEAVHVHGEAQFILQSAPENALRPDAGLHALIRRAGPGDAIWVQQLYEHKHWGSSDSNPIADPNPRLQLLIDAARRGAQVRIHLDRFFDSPTGPRSNRATADYLHTLAAQEGLDLEVRVGNPTRGGLHAKLFLIRAGDEYWSALGSLNGSETSHKLNREVVLIVDHPAIFARLLEVFLHDWTLLTNERS